MTAQQSLNPLDLSVVVPTFNESSNICELIKRLEQSLSGLSWEVIFVDDDSPDGTSDLIRDIARRDLRVRVVQRIGRRGLSSACIEGMLAASATVTAVMDADLQHDERVLPQMLETINNGGADIVVGTRYAEGGSIGEWDESRALMSRLATRASHLLIGEKVSDPMSGFFMLRRSALEACVRNISGRGYKILLDILASTKSKLQIKEVPYTFRNRFSGESKLDSFVIWEYGMLLIDKTVGRLIPPEFVSFCIIGGSGVLAHMMALFVLFRLIGVEFALSQSVATLSAMVLNFSLNNVLTYRDRRLTGARWWTGLASFIAVCSIGAIGNVGIASYLFSNDTQWALAAGAGIVISAVWNFGASRVYTWGKK